MNLPEKAKETIFHTSGEEYAWKRADIPDVVEALAEEDYAILGGEAWTVENGVICPTVPMPDGNSAIFVWDTEKRAFETWKQFVQRAAKETVSFIDKYNTEDEVPPEESAFVCYNLTYVTEKEYLELCEENWEF